MTYENELYSYDYSFSWDRRNKNYLKKVYDRKNIKEFIIPIVFRLRFYDKDNNILSDDTYSPSNNLIEFPTPPEVSEYSFIGWEFSYNNKLVTITIEDYTELKEAVMNGYDDIKLTASYEQIIQG